MVQYLGVTLQSNDRERRNTGVLISGIASVSLRAVLLLSLLFLMTARCSHAYLAFSVTSGHVSVRKGSAGNPVALIKLHIGFPAQA